MTESLKQGLLETVSESNWMDKETKQLAKKKVRIADTT